MGTGSILLADVPALAEMKLRAAMPSIEFTSLPPGRHSAEQLRSLGSAAVVSLGDDLESSFRLVRALDAAGLRVVVIGPRKDADLILRAMREGAKEFVLTGDEESLKRALRDHARP